MALYVLFLSRSFSPFITVNHKRKIYYEKYIQMANIINYVLFVIYPCKPSIRQSIIVRVV